MQTSGLQGLDGAQVSRKTSSQEEIVASSFGLIGAFLRHATESKSFEEEPFNRLKDFLNVLNFTRPFYYYFLLEGAGEGAMI